MDKISETELKVVYFDVLNGYTEVKDTILGDVLYSKHLNVFDSITSEKSYKASFEKAKANKLPTDEEQTAYLKREELWDEEKETKIYELERMIITLRETKSNLFLKSQIRSIEQQIEDTVKELQLLQVKKAEMMGLTAETYAQKKSNEQYMLQVLYADKEFKKPALPEEKYDALSDQDMQSLLRSHNKATRNVSLINLKRIALCPFFVNFFYLSDDNPYIFYGVPIVKLTYFQSELFAFGRYFKHLASESKNKPPLETQEDPDLLMEFYEMSRKAEQFMEKSDKRSGEADNAATTIVGATQEDLELIGMAPNEGDVDLIDFVKSKGGVVEMDEIMKLHS